MCTKFQLRTQMTNSVSEVIISKYNLGNFSFKKNISRALKVETREHFYAINKKSFLEIIDPRHIDSDKFFFIQPRSSMHTPVWHSSDTIIQHIDLTSYFVDHGSNQPRLIRNKGKERRNQSISFILINIIATSNTHHPTNALLRAGRWQQITMCQQITNNSN